MKSTGLARRCLLVAMAVALMASLVQADDQKAAKKNSNQIQVPTIHDIALHEGGTLKGALVDPQGKVLVDAAVSVLQNQQLAGSAKTDGKGMFAVSGLRGGLHQIVAGGEVRTIRLWAPGTAPPIAKQGLLMVRQPQALRGQGPGHHGHLPAWIEKGSLTSKDVIYGTALLGIVGGVTYWAIDYNKSGS